jgi:DNA-binding transcriptional LysR family regulator
VELKQLEQFIVLAEERHFSRAAARCHVAQSALSVSIRGLERDLGKPLFVRTTRRVDLTEAGRALLPEAHSVLAAARAARAAVRETDGVVGGTLAVGAVWGAIGCIIARYHARHPEVDIEVKQAISSILIEDVRTERLDLAFVVVPLRVPRGVHVLALEELPLVVACPESHPFAQQQSVQLCDLEGEAFIDPPSNTPGRVAFDKYFADAGVGRRTSFEVTDLASTLDLVSNGLGLALVPEPFSDLKPGVCCVPLAGSRLMLGVGVITGEGGSVSAAARAFVDMVEGPSSFIAAVRSSYRNDSPPALVG